MHVTADAMTAQPAPSIHAGINAQISRFTLMGNQSTSFTVSLTPLPAGAEVVDVNVYHSHDSFGSALAVVSVFATIGGLTTPDLAEQQYITSSLIGATLVFGVNRGGDIGKRLTASAILQLSYTGLSLVSTTSTGNITVVTEYLRTKRGD